MAHINLLPWRAEHRQEKQKEFLVLLGMAGMLSAAILALAFVHTSGLIDYQKKRNQFLDNETKLLDAKIAEIKELEATKKALIDRMNIIQELQSSRPGIVHIFDELVNTLPDGLYLKSISDTGGKLEITGAAESNARVSAYMRQLDKSDWLSNPSLSFIEVSKKQQPGKPRTYSFKLTVDLTQPGNPEDQKS